MELDRFAHAVSGGFLPKSIDDKIAAIMLDSKNNSDFRDARAQVRKSITNSTTALRISGNCFGL